MGIGFLSVTTSVAYKLVIADRPLQPSCNHSALILLEGSLLSASSASIRIAQALQAGAFPTAIAVSCAVEEQHVCCPHETGSKMIFGSVKLYTYR